MPLRSFLFIDKNLDPPPVEILEIGVQEVYLTFEGMLVAVICYSYELEDLLFLVLIPLPLSDDE
jgi:hypothetical protein